MHHVSAIEATRDTTSANYSLNMGQPSTREVGIATGEVNFRVLEQRARQAERPFSECKANPRVVDGS